MKDNGSPRAVAERMEKRIEYHLNQALTLDFSEKVDWNIMMANQWIDTLANYRNIPPEPSS